MLTFQPGPLTSGPSGILTPCSTRQRLGVGQPRGAFIAAWTDSASPQHRRGRFLAPLVRKLVDGSSRAQTPTRDPPARGLWQTPPVRTWPRGQAVPPGACLCIPRVGWQPHTRLDRIWGGLELRGSSGWLRWEGRCPGFGERAAATTAALRSPFSSQRSGCYFGGSRGPGRGRGGGREERGCPAPGQRDPGVFVY